MNAVLLEFWLTKALKIAQRQESKRNVLARDKVKQILLERMCDIARTSGDKHRVVENANMRYCDSNQWYAFEPSIFEMKDFASIIDDNLSGIMRDNHGKSSHYFQTLACSLMNQFYRENPLHSLN